jgi:hypothetical protein
VLEAECRIRCLDRSDRDSARHLTFLLHAHRPETYRNASKAKVPNMVEVESGTTPAPGTTDDRAEADRELSEW